MRNIFLFIRRYSNFFIFLFLQVLALWFLFSYNRFHRAKGMGMANELTGWVNSKFNKVENYFFLNQENKRLNRYIDSTLNLLPGNFARRDTSTSAIADSLVFDTSGAYRRYIFRPAIVVYNTVSSQKNYIQLDRGTNQGIKDNMGVVSSDGCVVGVVVNVSPNYSQVMSLLHVQSKLDAALKKTGEFGTIEWNGKDPRYLLLTRIPKTVPVVKGDSVITSANNSLTFPKGFFVGTIVDINVDNTSGNYLLKVKTATNFYNLQQVHIIENTDRNEQTMLNIETKKKIEASKRPR